MSDRDERGDDAEEEDDEFGPDSPDYDLSEEHGYAWDPKRTNWPVPPGVLLVISVLVVIALVLPTIVIVMQSD